MLDNNVSLRERVIQALSINIILSDRTTETTSIGKNKYLSVLDKLSEEEMKYYALTYHLNGSFYISKPLLKPLIRQIISNLNDNDYTSLQKAIASHEEKQRTQLSSVGAENWLRQVENTVAPSELDSFYFSLLKTLQLKMKLEDSILEELKPGM